ncbi:MAG: FAD-dependent oxidoreductase [Alphaproteobacteria bacterium]|nr:FAD-dependent oxidoreductase [Alphaproteobacteria bacterium]
MVRRVVLIGAGHAHMEALRQANRFEAAGLTLILIDPGAFWYSGAATGMLSGALDPSDATADPVALAGPVERLEARATRVDPGARRVTLDDGRSVAFDVLSLNTGSALADTGLVRSGAVPVKPVSNLAEVRARIEAAGGELRLAVAGGGATGVEVALSLTSLQRRLGADVTVTLFAPLPLLPGWPDRAADRAARALKQAGVRHVARRAETIRDGAVIDDAREAHSLDLIIAATGLTAQLPGGFDAGPEGLPVGADLAWLNDPDIFAAGDCAHMTHAPRPKLGVFGVRAAPVLIENLIAAGRGEGRRRRYEPQSRWLSLMDLGDGTALGRYGGLAHRSGAALALKRWIDARFVRRYQP